MWPDGKLDVGAVVQWRHVRPARPTIAAEARNRVSSPSIVAQQNTIGRHCR